MTLGTDTSSPNLTQYEVLALERGLNVSDGHARSDLTAQQAAIVDGLPELWRTTEQTAPNELDRRAQEAYLRAVGQASAPFGTGRIMSCYASSVAMEIFARAAATEQIKRVGLLHPTFDNIPDILRGFDFELVAVNEDVLHTCGTALWDVCADIECLFLTTPNNPTGKVLSEKRLAEVAQWCAESDVLLTLDTSFRGFAPEAQYDHYRILDASGCSWVVIEDTGKLWSTLDLKIGLLVHSEGNRLPLARIHSDILLGVSPLILALVEAFSEDAAAGGLTALQADIASKRQLVRELLPACVGSPDPDSKASVERVSLDGLATGVEVAASLRAVGVHVLECRPFHWAAPSEGEHMIRLALARPDDMLRDAVGALSAVASEFTPATA